MILRNHFELRRTNLVLFDLVGASGPACVIVSYSVWLLRLYTVDNSGRSTQATFVTKGAPRMKILLPSFCIAWTGWKHAVSHPFSLRPLVVPLQQLSLPQQQQSPQTTEVETGSTFWSPQSALRHNCQSRVSSIWHQCNTAKLHLTSHHGSWDPPSPPPLRLPPYAWHFHIKRRTNSFVGEKGVLVFLHNTIKRVQLTFVVHFSLSWSCYVHLVLSVAPLASITPKLFLSFYGLFLQQICAVLGDS